jgi:hypothetical protein
MIAANLQYILAHKLAIEKKASYSPLTLDMRPHGILQCFQCLTRQSWEVLMVPYPVPRLDGSNVPIQVKLVRHLEQFLKNFRRNLPSRVAVEGWGCKL